MSIPQQPRQPHPQTIRRRFIPHWATGGGVIKTVLIPGRNAGAAGISVGHLDTAP